MLKAGYIYRIEYTTSDFENRPTGSTVVEERKDYYRLRSDATGETDTEWCRTRITRQVKDIYDK